MLQNQIDESVATAVSEMLRTHAWGKYQGEATERLISEIRSAFRVEHVELCSSGTAGLEIVLRAMTVGVGEEVLLSGYDYPGNFWAIERCGARPALIDVLANQWAIDPSSLNSACTPACRAIVVSHLHGQLQEISTLRDWCRDHQMMLIEDACQAIGARIGTETAGTLGDAGILSFGGGKVISAGRGGAIITNNSELAQRIRIAAGAGSGPYAISQIQAAVVAAQLPFLNSINEHTRRYFIELQSTLANMGLPIFSPVHLESCFSGVYQCGWLFSTTAQSADHDQPVATIDSGKVDEFLHRSRTLGISAGRGFPGFFRRSERRCRVATTLQNAMEVATRTFVLHHKLAFDPAWPALRVAETIAQLLPSVGIK